jgi:hypothetical protein
MYHGRRNWSENYEFRGYEKIFKVVVVY